MIHTYSGYEDKVKTNLEQRIKSMDAEELVFRVVVPSVDEIEIKEGQRRTVPRKIFPGYVLVQMITLKQEDPAASEQDKALSSKGWTVVRNSPGVTGFVGSGTAPTPLDETEVRSIIKQMRADEPRVKVGFQAGQSVRVTDGPFADFVGTVEEINAEERQGEGRCLHLRPRNACRTGFPPGGAALAPPGILCNRRRADQRLALSKCESKDQWQRK